MLYTWNGHGKTYLRVVQRKPIWSILQKMKNGPFCPANPTHTHKLAIGSSSSSRRRTKNDLLKSSNHFFFVAAVADDDRLHDRLTDDDEKEREKNSRRRRRNTNDSRNSLFDDGGKSFELAKRAARVEGGGGSTFRRHLCFATWEKGRNELAQKFRRATTQYSEISFWLRLNLYFSLSTNDLIIWSRKLQQSSNISH